MILMEGFYDFLRDCSTVCEYQSMALLSIKLSLSDEGGLSLTY